MLRFFLLPCGGGFPKPGLEAALRSAFAAQGEEIVVVPVQAGSDGGQIETAHLLELSATNPTNYRATIIQGWSAGGGAAINLANDPRYAPMISGLILYGAAADGTGTTTAHFTTKPILQWHHPEDSVIQYAYAEALYNNIGGAVNPRHTLEQSNPADRSQNNHQYDEAVLPSVAWAVQHFSNAAQTAAAAAAAAATSTAAGAGNGDGDGDGDGDGAVAAGGGGQKTTAAKAGSTEVCRSFRNTGLCRYGVECKYEHSEGDRIEPPPRKQCLNWLQTGKCSYRDRCRFLHGDDDGGQPKAKSDEICNNYLKGRCRYGDQCQRKHVGEVVPQKVEKMDEVCRNFLEGRCRFGDFCRRQHPADSK